MGFWQQTEPESALLEILVNVNWQAVSVDTLFEAMTAEGMDKLRGTKAALKTLYSTPSPLYAL